MTKTQQILADWPCCLSDRASVKAEEGGAPNYQVCCFSPVPSQNNKIKKSKDQKLLTTRTVRAAGQIPSRLNHCSSKPLRSESSMVREVMVQGTIEQFLGGRIFWETSLRRWSGLLVVVEIFWELVAPVVPEKLSSRFWRVISVQVISNKEEGQSHLGEANTCNRHIWPRTHLYCTVIHSHYSPVLQEIARRVQLWGICACPRVLLSLILLPLLTSPT